MGWLTGFLGNVVGDITGQNQSNAYQEQVNQEQINQSNTVYQRGVADLKAAGLNPVLAASQGMTDPVASQTAPQGVNVAKFLADAASAASTGYGVLNLAADITNKRAQAQVNEATVGKIRAETDQTAAQTQLTQAQTHDTQQRTGYEPMKPGGINKADYDRIIQQAHLNNAELALVNRQVDNAEKTGAQIEANTGNTKVDTVLKELEAKGKAKTYSDYYQSWAGRSEPYLRLGDEALGTISSAVGAVTPGLKVAPPGSGRSGNLGFRIPQN